MAGIDEQSWPHRSEQISKVFKRGLRVLYACAAARLALATGGLPPGNATARLDNKYPRAFADAAQRDWQNDRKWI
ncbi:MAG: hypothetical protein ABI330_04810 [Caldimonas sp.]